VTRYDSVISIGRSRTFKISTTFVQNIYWASNVQFMGANKRQETVPVSCIACIRKPASRT
jgi:hypothetical protein